MDRTLFRKVRSILIRRWDPIGVRSFNSFDEETDPEYDAYAAQLADILARGGGLTEVEDYLAFAEDHIGVDPSPSRVKRVAALLVAEQDGPNFDGPSAE